MDIDHSDDLLNLLRDEDPEVTEEELNIVPIKGKEIPNELLELAPAPDVKTRVYIDSPYIKELTSEDFNITNATLIDLKNEPEYKGYWFIVFIEESNKGKEFLQRWIELSRIVKKDFTNLAYCNFTFEKKIFENFKDLRKIDYINHPFKWAKFTEVPFMMVYRDWWPCGFYNGALYQQDLVNYIMDKIPDSLIELDKQNFRRMDYGQMVEESERRLETEELKERGKKEEVKRKQKITEIDPRKQEVSEGINFLSS